LVIGAAEVATYDGARRTEPTVTGWDNRNAGDGRQRFTAVVRQYRSGRNTAMVEYVKALVAQYLPEETEGQGLVEYALIIVLVSIAAIATLTLLGTTVSGVFTTITNAL
jgi:pilus assembly protein Flp/PilA